MKKLPEFITFTGIDDFTNLNRADALAKKYPIEWGILFNDAPKFGDARYPKIATVNDILSIAGKKAAHLCRGFSEQVQKGTIPEGIPLNQFDRVQVNGEEVLTDYFSFLAAKCDVQVIRQVREEGFALNPLHLELYDLSGGKGIVPDVIPSHPNQTSLVGYAGGMSPDTVLNYLAKIDGTGPYWIDMEGNVRTNGLFDLDKVEAVCTLVYGEY